MWDSLMRHTATAMAKKPPHLHQPNRRGQQRPERYCTLLLRRLNMPT